MGAARQGELFSAAAARGGGCGGAAELPLLRHQLQAWQWALARHQAPLFAGGDRGRQVELFEPLQPNAAITTAQPLDSPASLNPLRLQAQPLSFWRWPDPPQRGAALYFVLDSLADGPGQGLQPLLLYVGETGRADRRWKGEHDCKRYLASYSEALARVRITSRPNIRFWLDAPQAARPRQAFEQALIQRWLPPFNKETRQRWGTPFTADGD
ncbi:MAG: GIY-YIG nuclease family protein [Cyanobacteria bacterium J06638_7]